MKTRITNRLPKLLVFLAGVFSVSLFSVFVSAQVSIPLSFDNAVEYIKRLVVTDSGWNTGNVLLDIDGSDHTITINTGYVADGSSWNSKALWLSGDGQLIYIDQAASSTGDYFPLAGNSIANPITGDFYMDNGTGNYTIEIGTTNVIVWVPTDVEWPIISPISYVPGMWPFPIMVTKWWNMFLGEPGQNTQMFISNADTNFWTTFLQKHDEAKFSIVIQSGGLMSYESSFDFLNDGRIQAHPDPSSVISNDWDFITKWYFDANSSASIYSADWTIADANRTINGNGSNLFFNNLARFDLATFSDGITLSTVADILLQTNHSKLTLKNDWVSSVETQYDLFVESDSILKLVWSGWILTRGGYFSILDWMTFCDSNGCSYATDYSWLNTSNDRWLVDKWYVDWEIAWIETFWEFDWVTLNPTATWDISLKIWLGSQANTSNSASIGQYAYAKWTGSYAFGNSAWALWEGSVAIGQQANADGRNAYSVWFNNQANQEDSYVFGVQSVANWFGSMTLWQYATSNNTFSTAIWYSSQANADYSISAGNNTITNSASSMAIWKYNIWSYDSVFEVGYGTNGTNRANLFEVKQNWDIYVSKLTGYTCLATDAAGMVYDNTLTGFLAASTVSTLTTNYVPYRNGAAFANSALFYNDNKVGIGTDTPSQALDISGSMATQSLIISQDKAGNACSTTWEIIFSGGNFMGCNGSDWLTFN